jgi:hypothetical protein
MERVKVKAQVLRNTGTEAVLKPLDGNEVEVTFFRDKESLGEFLRMFPPRTVIEIICFRGPRRAQGELMALAVKGNMSWDEIESILRRSA